MSDNRAALSYKKLKEKRRLFILCKTSYQSLNHPLLARAGCVIFVLTEIRYRGLSRIGSIEQDHSLLWKALLEGGRGNGDEVFLPNCSTGGMDLPYKQTTGPVCKASSSPGVASARLWRFWC